MPSLEHEVLIELFRTEPALAAALLRDALGIEIPIYTEARIDSCDLTDHSPTEYRADAVIALTAGNGVRLAVIVEVQLARDPRKRWSWSVYATTLRARLRCPRSPTTTRSAFSTRSFEHYRR